MDCQGEISVATSMQRTGLCMAKRQWDTQALSALMCLKKKTVKSCELDLKAAVRVWCKNTCKPNGFPNCVFTSPRTPNAADEHETCRPSNSSLHPDIHLISRLNQSIHLFYLLMADHLNFGIHYTSLKVYVFSQLFIIYDRNPLTLFGPISCTHLHMLFTLSLYNYSY